MYVFFKKGLKFSCLFLSILFFNIGLYPQEEEEPEPAWGTNWSVPNMLRRPDRGESPRFPRDLVIGELGQGEAPSGAYVFARNLLYSIIRENGEHQILTENEEEQILIENGEEQILAENGEEQILTESNTSLSNIRFKEISAIRTRNFRIGGGRIEPDGHVSFLFRFIGPEESISGELFISQTEDSDGNIIWRLDDFILEERRLLREIRDSYRYDFSHYERFF